MVDMIDYDRLNDRAEDLRRSFADAKPFRWLEVDDFLKPEYARQLGDEFGEVIARSKKDPDAAKKHRHVLRKIGVMHRHMMNEVHRQFFEAVAEPRFIQFLEVVTGVSPLYADPELQGGGLHEIYRGGYLNVHTDFNFHPTTGKHRRLNLLFYLNPAWDDSWEGHLELWPTDLSEPFAKITPILNRMAIFETSEISFHGHPKPLNLPEHMTRRSMATYYYADWPEGLERREKTNYQLVPWQVERITHEIRRLREKGLDDKAVLDEISQSYQLADVARVLKQNDEARAA